MDQYWLTLVTLRRAGEIKVEKNQLLVDKYNLGDIKCKDDTSKVLLLKKCMLVNFVGVLLFSAAGETREPVMKGQGIGEYTSTI